ncbi:MAG: hypothetical protein ACR2PT_12455 [Endozoicomonas sp.]
MPVKPPGADGSSPLSNQPKPLDEKETSQSGELTGRRVTSHSPEATQMSKADSQAENQNLKSRKVRKHSPDGLNLNQLSTARQLIGKAVWPGVESWLSLHATSLEQLHQLIDFNQHPNARTEQFQGIVAKHYSQLSAQALARDLLATSADEETASQLETLMAITNPPRSASSPVGAVVRLKVAEFIQQNDNCCTQYRQQMIRSIEQEIYSLADIKLRLLEDELQQDYPELEDAIKQARNERTITRNHYQNLLMSKA